MNAGLYHYSTSTPYQKRLIDRLTDEEEFVLVVLDACRFDMFDLLYGEYLSGDLRKVLAAGRWTADYARRTWTGRHDLTYVTSMPVVSDFYFELRGDDYRPSDHIETVVPLWDTEWDPELGTVPAERVTDAALAHASRPGPTRLVAHYAQPHVPYVGRTRILPWEEDAGAADEGMRQLLAENRARPTQRIYDRIRSGDISRAELRQAYKDNLVYALEEVVRLVERVDCPVVVTGDHGEHLGERGKYLHERDSLLIRQVPWFEVADDQTGRREIEPEYAERDPYSEGQRQSSEEIRGRLANLGYVE